MYQLTTAYVIAICQYDTVDDMTSNHWLMHAMSEQGNATIEMSEMQDFALTQSHTVST